MFLLIDNYDSFTYNLFHYLSELGADVKVIRNDKIEAQQALALAPQGIVLSPGPGTPDDAGVCLDLVEKAAQAGVPVLGVCLGHQVIGQVFGGKIVRAPHLLHGKTSVVHHLGAGLFDGLPTPYRATRYHSLILDRESVPADLTVTAWSDDGLVMALAHKTLSIMGVQFHPESIASEHGHALLRNFIAIAEHTPTSLATEHAA